MDFTAIDTALLQDIILILISGSACLYCGSLNRRLKKLQNLKTGVGASIVSLTDAITQTNKAAKDAQTTTLATVETLRHLLGKAEAATPKIEALITELAHSTDAVKTHRKHAKSQINEELIPAIDKAQLTAACLLEAVNDVEDYIDKVNHRIAVQKSGKVKSLAEARDQKTDILSVISL